MAKDKTRQTTRMPFKGKAIQFYRPTQGQATALVLSSRLKGSDAVVRYFHILELLVVKPSDWTFMEGKLIDGSADVNEYADLLTELVSREWDEEDPEKDSTPAPAGE